MAIYLSRKKGGTVATPITPSNSNPAQMTANTPVNPTGNGYAIASYNTKTPSNSSPVALTSGEIDKIGGNGYAIQSYDMITPSSTPTSVSAFDVVMIGGSGVIVDSIPTPPSITPSNASPAALTSGSAVTPSANGYAIESYSSITPSNSSPATITSGSIYKASANGKAVASVTDITPTTIDGPVSMSANTVYRPTVGSYAINSYTTVSSSDTNPPNLTTGNMYRIPTTAGAGGYLYKSSGLGKCKAGTFTSSTSSQTINLGFQPKYLLVMTDGRTSNIYDVSYSSTQAVYAATNAYSTNYTISGNSSNNHISAISSTGFTYNKSGSAGSTIYYFAVG